MVNYREILRLKSLGYSQRQVATSVHSSRDTVSSVYKLADIHELDWPLPDEMSNHTIQEMFFPERKTSTRQVPDYAYMHKELAKSGVTLTLLWAEYCETCYANHTVPYQYTQLCDNYRLWAKSTKATMRIKRKPGDIMEVDWAGNSLRIYDSVTGEEIPAYLFVAVLPCSCYAYVEAFLDHGTENWILAHIHAYQYFGGVTRILIPDNLKTGVITNTRNELKLNRSYLEMAEYYDTAIIPARVKSPKDKPNAEDTVNHTSIWIIAALRNDKYFTIHELNEAIAKKLESFNARPFKQREGSRLTAFQNEEKSFLKPLPTSPYELAVWSTATIQYDYLITDGKNKYSVPFDLIGQEISVRLTSNTVEAFYQGSRVTSHPRLKVKQRDPIVKVEHMPDNHKKYLAYNKESFLEWAAAIGPNTSAVVKTFLSSGKVPEQGYKSCASLSNMADKYSHHRLEDACSRALAYTTAPNIKIIRTILKTGQDKVKKDEPSSTLNGSSYGFTRGASYFGGEHND
ncbi:IS21 family transposase [Clostridium sp. HV4-5-A1G]|uniref:IS21 family transposase n=1 Tax=Clostridium sp. HV4-5-A1G TaxID=2004595 RepID=UPI001239BB09|nr:IS21 family transposase [Clostridium sp. HV4-5-A1G]KAA8675279.1 IS21 family transposase [Clostridium sp. HV4-5-A1G]